MDYDEDEYYDEEQTPRRSNRTGFCGAIENVMKRPTQKLFASMDDVLED